MTTSVPPPDPSEVRIDQHLVELRKVEDRQPVPPRLLALMEQLVDRLKEKDS
ncbi:hypothetical protein [Paracoccus sp. (in: a-proteobacteria)]|uniref:hypothetical protein n=1 Tax=Paracoccus sp. TaxID=267 RepID=UPI00396C9B5E